jgi:hypothetical protein
MSIAFKRPLFREQKNPHASIESSIKRVPTFKKSQVDVQPPPKDNRSPRKRREALSRTRFAKV